MLSVLIRITSVRQFCHMRPAREACAFTQFNRIFHWAHFGLTRMQSVFMQTTKTLIRLRGCAVWFESSLYAHVRSYVSDIAAYILCIDHLWQAILFSLTKSCSESISWNLVVMYLICFNYCFTCCIHFTILTQRIETRLYSITSKMQICLK